jgi:ribosomal protein S1
VDSPETSSPSRLADLKPKMKLAGRVTRIELFGAFVDVGVEREGLLHISMLSREVVNRVEDVVKVGQTLDVWVHHVDEIGGRLDLTLIRPLAHEWRDLKPGMRTTGKVVKLEPFGAFVDIGAERSGLVHVSEMSNDYVSRPEDVVHVGDEVEVAVLEVDRKKKQIRLSMKAAVAPAEAEIAEDEEPVATAMELALRKALESGESRTPATTRPAPQARPRAHRSQQDEILSRTLQQKLRTASEE